MGYNKTGTSPPMIILASNSWLRKSILEASEFDFQVYTKEIDERALEAQHTDKSDADVATILATAKAEAIADEQPDNLVIAADTFVVLPNGDRLHKPSSAEEAVELCLAQSGKTIQAVTGIAMAYNGKLVTGSTTTSVTYVNFTRKTIERLLTGNDVTIRNSGLGLFLDAPGFTLVKDFDGSYTGAMGLPMETVREYIDVLGYSHA